MDARSAAAVLARIASLLDVEGAAQELAMTERQLHELVDRLRVFAGVEEMGGDH